MKKSCVCLAAGAVLAALTGAAETVAKVIMTPSYDWWGTRLRTIDENGTWGDGPGFTSRVNSQDNLMVNNAVANRGIVYQLESTSNDGIKHTFEKWEIYRFDYDGRRLDAGPAFSISDCGHAKGLCATPDGKYLFVGIYQSYAGANESGRIYRFDLAADGTLQGDPTLFAQFSAINNRTQHLTTDGKGNLYVADRGTSYVYKLAIESGDTVYNDSTYTARSSCTAETLHSVSYNPADGNIYAGNWNEVYVFDAATMTYQWQTTPSGMHQYFSSICTGGDVYFGSAYNGQYPWKVDVDNESLVQMTTGWTSTYNALDALKPWTAREWKFDEPAGAGGCAGGAPFPKSETRRVSPLS